MSGQDEGDQVSQHGLLAIDLGLKTGLAYFSGDGRLQRYHAQHFANRSALKKQVYGTLRGYQPLSVLVTEGDQALAKIWQKLPEKWGAQTVHIQAQHWREELLLFRERSYGGAKAKSVAQQRALDVISWSGADLPYRDELRHDAAEAILIGLWGVLQQGWIEESTLDEIF